MVFSCWFWFLQRAVTATEITNHGRHTSSVVESGLKSDLVITKHVHSYSNDDRPHIHDEKQHIGDQIPIEKQHRGTIDDEKGHTDNGIDTFSEEKTHKDSSDIKDTEHDVSGKDNSFTKHKYNSDKEISRSLIEGNGLHGPRRPKKLLRREQKSVETAAINVDGVVDNRNDRGSTTQLVSQVNSSVDHGNEKHHQKGENGNGKLDRVVNSGNGKLDSQDNGQAIVTFSSKRKHRPSEKSKVPAASSDAEHEVSESTLVETSIVKETSASETSILKENSASEASIVKEASASKTRPSLKTQESLSLASTQSAPAMAVIPEPTTTIIQSASPALSRAANSPTTGISHTAGSSKEFLDSASIKPSKLIETFGRNSEGLTQLSSIYARPSSSSGSWKGSLEGEAATAEDGKGSDSTEKVVKWYTKPVDPVTPIHHTEPTDHTSRTFQPTSELNPDYADSEVISAVEEARGSSDHQIRDPWKWSEVLLPWHHRECNPKFRVKNARDYMSGENPTTWSIDNTDQHACKFQENCRDLENCGEGIRDLVANNLPKVRMEFDIPDKAQDAAKEEKSFAQQDMIDIEVDGVESLSAIGGEALRDEKEFTSAWKLLVGEELMTAFKKNPDNCNPEVIVRLPRLRPHGEFEVDADEALGHTYAPKLKECVGDALRGAGQATTREILRKISTGICSCLQSAGIQPSESRWWYLLFAFADTDGRTATIRFRESWDYEKFRIAFNNAIVVGHVTPVISAVPTITKITIGLIRERGKELELPTLYFFLYNGEDYSKGFDTRRS